MQESAESAVIAWLPPAHPNGIILKYGVYVRTMDNGHQVDMKNTHHPPGNLRYTLRGINKPYVYECFVTAFTKVGEGQSSSVATVTPSATGNHYT